jgi:hypothetical protein
MSLPKLQGQHKKGFLPHQIRIDLFECKKVLLIKVDYNDECKKLLNYL